MTTKTTHTAKHPTVVIDWTAVSLSSEVLLSWVRSHPERASIHVYLPLSTTLTPVRRIQGMLQSLGCTVTRRLSPI